MIKKLLFLALLFAACIEHASAGGPLGAVGGLPAHANFVSISTGYVYPRSPSFGGIILGGGPADFTFTNSAETGQLELDLSLLDFDVTRYEPNKDGTYALVEYQSCVLAAVTQSSSDAPTGTEMINTTGVTFTFDRRGVGYYQLLLSPAIPDIGKIIFLATNGAVVGSISYDAGGSATDAIKFKTVDGSGNPSDDILSGASLEIRIYP